MEINCNHLFPFFMCFLTYAFGNRKIISKLLLYKNPPKIAFEIASTTPSSTIGSNKNITASIVYTISIPCASPYIIPPEFIKLLQNWYFCNNIR